jgi:hypothetical protein
MYINAIYWDIKLNLGLCFNWDIPKTKFALLLFSFYDSLQLFLPPTKLEKTKNSLAWRAERSEYLRILSDERKKYDILFLDRSK